MKITEFAEILEASIFALGMYMGTLYFLVETLVPKNDPHNFMGFISVILGIIFMAGYVFFAKWFFITKKYGLIDGYIEMERSEKERLPPKTNIWISFIALVITTIILGWVLLMVAHGLWKDMQFLAQPLPEDPHYVNRFIFGMTGAAIGLFLAAIFNRAMIRSRNYLAKKLKLT